MTIIAEASTRPTGDPPAARHERFDHLDALRGLSCLAIVVYHCAIVTKASERNVAGAILARLNIGVPIFFAISGFVIFRPFVASDLLGLPRQRLRDYARHRFLRIVPAYWVALTVMAAIPYLRHAMPPMADVASGSWWHYYGFLQAYSLKTTSNGFGHAWTLDVEVAFYALVPLIAIAIGPRLRSASRVRAIMAGLAAFSVLSIAIRVYAQADASRFAHIGWLDVSLLACFQWFAVGIALAVVSVRRQAAGAAAPRWTRAGPAVALALFLLTCFGLGLPRAVNDRYTLAQYIAEPLLFGAVAGLLMAPLVFTGPDLGSSYRWLLNLGPLRHLGRVSYGLYLWHVPVIYVLIGLDVIERFRASPFFAMTSLSLSLSLALAVASWYSVEKPAARLRRRARAPQPGDQVSPLPAARA